MSGGALCPRLVQQTHCTARTVCQLASPLSINDVQTGSSREDSAIRWHRQQKKTSCPLCPEISALRAVGGQLHARLSATTEQHPPPRPLLPYPSSPTSHPLPYPPLPHLPPHYTHSACCCPPVLVFPTRHPNNAGRPVKAIKPHITVVLVSDAQLLPLAAIG